MESQPQNPEFRNNPENFRPCVQTRQSLCCLHTQNMEVDEYNGYKYQNLALTHLVFFHS